MSMKWGIKKAMLQTWLEIDINFEILENRIKTPRFTMPKIQQIVEGNKGKLQ